MSRLYDMLPNSLRSLGDAQKERHPTSVLSEDLVRYKRERNSSSKRDERRDDDEKISFTSLLRVIHSLC